MEQFNVEHWIRTLERIAVYITAIKSDIDTLTIHLDKMDIQIRQLKEEITHATTT